MMISFLNQVFSKAQKNQSFIKLLIISEKKLSYDKDGAIWYKSTDFGDEKDRF